MLLGVIYESFIFYIWTFMYRIWIILYDNQLNCINDDDTFAIEFVPKLFYTVHWVKTSQKHFIYWMGDQNSSLCIEVQKVDFFV